MKLTALVVLATAASFCAAAPAEAAKDKSSANGLYVTTFDDAGNKDVKFTPESEFVNSTALAALRERSEEARASLEKRREGCGAYVLDAHSDVANRLLLETYPGDSLALNGKSSVSYRYESATSYVCSYSSGWKPKSSIAGTWDWVKRTKCGYNKGGYGQVQEGSGDWTAGYTWNGDHFC